jgi:hypothetical protein
MTSHGDLEHKHSRGHDGHHTVYKKMPKITTCLYLIPTSRTRPAQLTIAAFLRRLFVQTELNRNF